MLRYQCSNVGNIFQNCERNQGHLINYHNNFAKDLLCNLCQMLIISFIIIVIVTIIIIIIITTIIIKLKNY